MMLDAKDFFVGVLRFFAAAAVALSPYACEWVMNRELGIPNTEEQFIEEVKGGWR